VGDAKLHLLGYGAIHSAPNHADLNALCTPQFAKDWDLKIQIVGKVKHLVADMWRGQGIAISDGVFFFLEMICSLDFRRH